MDNVTQLLVRLTARLRELAAGNAVVAKKVSVGDRHVIPLCELSLGFGGGGAQGEGTDPNNAEGGGRGTAGGAGGGAKASPVAVIVVEDGKVRIESLGL
jgi:uncharacterized spore protein YtfJ